MTKLNCDIKGFCKSSLICHSFWDLLVICHYNCLSNRAILSRKNSTIEAIILVTKKRLYKAFDKFSNYHSNIVVYLNIAKYSNIARRIFELIKLSMKNKS